MELRSLAVACVLACMIHGQAAFSLDDGAPPTAALSTTTSSAATSTSDGSPARSSRRKKLDKLKLANFPRYQAQILLPVQYQRKDDNGQLTAVGADIPHGMYMFMSMRGPENIRLDANAIKPILKGIIEGMKAECSGETALKLSEYEGLECRGKVSVDADVEAVVRGYVAGRRMYFVTVMGTGPWVRSAAVIRYLDSLVITP
ncbi:MAG: hypothetical protein SGJ27_17505 [Candidatus Melainabacteria bacterium]|nr:hypothetical protein [Candidatus Melainabacteria bacterium]